MINGLVMFGGGVGYLPLQAMVQQELIGAEEKGAAATCHVEHAKGRRGFAAGEIGWAFAFNLFTDCVLNDVVNDIGWGVVHAAGFADFGLFLHFRLMSGGQADDFTEESFVHRAQNFYGQNAEVIRAAMFEVEALENGLEGFIVHNQTRRERVRRIGDAGFFFEVEQAGVVFLIGFTAQSVYKMFVDIRLFTEFEELPFRLKSAIFSHSQENDPVNNPLNGGVEIVCRQIAVA